MESIEHPQRPPADFLIKMEALLGDAYAPFADSFQQPARVGLRVNTNKISTADFSSKSPFALTRLGNYAPAGFLLPPGTRPGRHPFHHAGLYYLQEPSAMAVAGILRPQPDELVLDLAAAPGGKATHISALMQDRGLLLANDIDGRRSRILAENLTRWGARNTMVTSVRPEQLADKFGALFDRVLVDAPCSGEGMFRRLGEVAWEQKLVLACARRQTAVLETAARLVRPGGQLVYATCTFAPEEDEIIIARFLETHTDFNIVDPPRFAGFSRGRPDWVPAELSAAGLENTVRLWPHKMAGEGHFIALLQRQAGGVGVEAEGNSARFLWQPPGRTALTPWQAFAAETLREPYPTERLYLKNNRLYLLPERTLDSDRLKLIRYGLLLGEIRGRHFRPAQALALKAKDVTSAVELPAASAEMTTYLAGHDLPANQAKGWTLVTTAGYGLGWGKMSGGVLKNHYPHGLRQQPARGALQ